MLTDYVRSFLQTYILGKVYNIDTQFFIGIGVAVIWIIWILIREKSSSSLHPPSSVSLSRMRLRRSDVQQVGIAVAALAEMKAKNFSPCLSVF